MVAKGDSVDNLEVCYIERDQSGKGKPYLRIGTIFGSVCVFMNIYNEWTGKWEVNQYFRYLNEHIENFELHAHLRLSLWRKSDKYWELIDIDMIDNDKGFPPPPPHPIEGMEKGL